MKTFVSCCALLLCAFLLPSFAQSASSSPQGTPKAPASGTATAGTSTTKTPPVTVAPGERKSQNGITVTNGNYNEQFPLYDGSTGKARLKQGNPDDTKSEVKTDNGFKGKIEGIETGDTVITGPSSNPIDISGTGGSVSVGSGTTCRVTNTAAAGGASITCTTPGGSTVSIPPGSTATITG